MGKPPAVVIIARHGARLDVADANWQQSSPAAYDPPLTYGGWTQCKALGGRIAALLQSRESLFEQTLKETLSEVRKENVQQQEANLPAVEEQQRRQKKHRVIIHSSPFLRCVQTSVAISAGISQHRGFNISSTDGHSESQPGEQLSKAQAQKARKPTLESIRDEDEERGSVHISESATKIFNFKPRLRVDAFLGEWLCPEYYETIQAPPSSVMMVATAKAELLRRGESIQVKTESLQPESLRGYFPGGWKSRIEIGDRLSSQHGILSDRLANSQISHSKFSTRDRAQIYSDSTPPPKRSQSSMTQNSSALPDEGGYLPPIPPYAISPSDPIPSGYVQHARDACIDVDFQWDSMRAPQDWGDGGEFGEEWSTMHKRFRKGLHGMVSWYTLHRDSPQQLHGHPRKLHPHPNEPDDDDTDLVLVLVTHGAGCNAMIGALTNQPVLLDVAMASLTMAIRRDDSQSIASTSPASRTQYAPTSPSLARYGNERPLSHDYAVCLTASTDHLTTTPFAPVSLLDLQPKSEAPVDLNVTRRSSRRRRFDFIPGHDRSSSMSELQSSHGEDMPRLSHQRSNTGNLTPSRSASDSANSSSGLWTRPGRAASSATPRTWSIVSSDSTEAQQGLGLSIGVMRSPTSVPSQD